MQTAAKEATVGQMGDEGARGAAGLPPAQPARPEATRGFLELPEAATVRECRLAWARGREVRLSLTDRCIVRTVIGRIRSVAVTGAFVVCDGWHVPTGDVLAVGNPTLAEREEYAAQLAAAELQMARDAEAAQGVIR